jgi:hypothetical protein
MGPNERGGILDGDFDAVLDDDGDTSTETCPICGHETGEEHDAGPCGRE